MQKFTFTFHFWKRFAVLVLLMMGSLSIRLEAQEANIVKGVVTSKDESAAMAGVTVVIKSTKEGTVTDVNGKYSIHAPVGAILVFSTIGYETVQSTVTGGTLNVSLETQHNSLNEVVVIGYGTTTRQNITTAVAKVDPKNIPQAANNSVEELLFGRAAGLQVQQSSTQPGGGINLSIRGRGAPLIVVDGVIFPNSGIEPGNGSSTLSGTDGVDRGALAGLNPEDIESIEVLKDASAAIYGVSAANGVVLITTKKGKAGALNISYNGSYSAVRNAQYLQPLNATQYETIDNQLFIDQYLGQHSMAPFGPNPATGVPAAPYSASTIAAAGAGTNWLAQIFRPGSIDNQQLSVSGGTDKTTYYFSGGYYDQVGTIKGSGLTKYTGRSNVSFKLTKFLTLNTNFTGNSNVYQNTSAGGQENGAGNQAFGITQAALGYPSNVPLRQPNGSLSQYGTISNPVSLLQIQDNTAYHSLSTNISLDAKITTGLSAHLLYGDNYEASTRNFSVPGTIFYEDLNLSRGALTYVDRESQTVEGTVAYKSSFLNKTLNLDAVGGIGQYKNTYSTFSAQGSGDADAIGTTNLNAETGNLGIFSNQTQTTLRSYFARATVDYLDRYLLSLSYRYDGYSYFFPQNKYASFPSASLGWKINNESFMKSITAIDLLKLRGSIGVTGSTINNAAYGGYSPDGNAIYFNNGNTEYVTITRYANDNPNLAWQKTVNKDIGLDFGLFQDRIAGSVDVYKDDITNLLAVNTTAPLDFIPTAPVNGGHQVREGYDIGLTTQNVRTKDFSWSSTINVSHFVYKWLTRFVFNPIQPYQSVTDPVDEMYYFKTKGLIQIGQTVPSSQPAAGGASLPGSPLIEDVNNDGKLDKSDVFKLNPDPKISIGFGNTFRYKQFDLSVFFYGQFGGTSINPNDVWSNPQNIVAATQGGTVGALDTWTTANQSGTRPGVNYVESAAGLLVGTNENFVSTSFVRCRNLTFGYTLNSSAVNKFAKSIRVFVDAQNLFIITGYKGLDPEVDYVPAGFAANSLIKGGFAPFPITRTFSIGIKAGF